MSTYSKTASLTLLAATLLISPSSVALAEHHYSRHGHHGHHGHHHHYHRRGVACSSCVECDGCDAAATKTPPRQYYTGWEYDDRDGQEFWRCRYLFRPGDTGPYQELIVVNRKENPGIVYYFDKEKDEFVGAVRFNDEGTKSYFWVDQVSPTLQERGKKIGALAPPVLIYLGKNRQDPNEQGTKVTLVPPPGVAR